VNALDLLSQTRVRAFDFSESTRTEPLPFLTERTRPGSSASSCELASDLVGFLSEDPLGYDVGINLYAYVYSDPVAAKDPRGLFAVCSGVPDAFPGVFNFTDACQKHDNCYGSCGRSKPECDWEFYKGMRAECARRGYARWNCNRIAETYYYGVDHFGGTFYNAAQTSSGCLPCSATPRPPPPTPVPPRYSTQ